MECRVDMPGNATVDMFLTFYHIFFVYFQLECCAQIKSKLRSHGLPSY